MAEKTSLEAASTELLEWCQQEGNELGSEGYQATAAKVQRAAAGLKSKDLTQIATLTSARG